MRAVTVLIPSLAAALLCAACAGHGDRANLKGQSNLVYDEEARAEAVAVANETGSSQAAVDAAAQVSTEKSSSDTPR